MSREISDLIARLEAASGPDRELDRDIGLGIGGWRYEPHSGHGTLLYVPEDNCLYADHPGAMYPSFTESIDATVALAMRVLPGWGNSSIKTSENEYAGYVWQRGDIRCHEFSSEGIRSSRAIALLIATLKAKEATHE